MAELITAVNELLKGRRAEENLHVYIDSLSSLYNRMAYLRISMNFYTFAEIYYELEPGVRDRIKHMADRVCSLVRSLVTEPQEKDAPGEASGHGRPEEEAEAVRDGLIKLMEILTAYTDRFQVYEYMLNRVEFRFKEPRYSDAYYGGGFERDIEKYIVSDTDNAVVNMKIAQVVGQLPMRLSQNKFFDILNNAFTLYKSSDRMAVDDFAYMIRTAGLLYEPDGFETAFPEFSELNGAFCGTDFSNIDSEGYDRLSGLLERASALAGQYSDACVMLTEVVNDAYSMALTQNALNDVGEREMLTEVIREAYSSVTELRAPSPEAYKTFDEIIGLQEKTGQLIYTPEVTLDEIRSINGDEIARLGLEERIAVISKLAKLQSPSTFARLSSAPEAMECGGDIYAANTARELMTEFSRLFEGRDRMFKRAVMSSVISNLPVFFNNMDEFREYVHVSLGQCSDAAERQACMSLINMMIAGE